VPQCHLAQSSIRQQVAGLDPVALAIQCRAMILWPANGSDEHAYNDNNCAIWTGPLVFRRSLALAVLLFGLAISVGCSMVVKSYVPGIH
jgi:hypothetical protein